MLRFTEKCLLTHNAASKRIDSETDGTSIFKLKWRINSNCLTLNMKKVQYVTYFLTHDWQCCNVLASFDLSQSAPSMYDFLLINKALCKSANTLKNNSQYLSV